MAKNATKKRTGGPGDRNIHIVVHVPGPNAQRFIRELADAIARDRKVPGPTPRERGDGAGPGGSLP